MGCATWHPSAKSLGVFGDQNGSNRSAFRALEVSNGGSAPPTATLEQWDDLLQRGYRIGASGGSDVHCAGRSKTGLPNDRSTERNEGIAKRSLTYAYFPSLAGSRSRLLKHPTIPSVRRSQPDEP